MGVGSLPSPIFKHNFGGNIIMINTMKGEDTVHVECFCIILCVNTVSHGVFYEIA